MAPEKAKERLAYEQVPDAQALFSPPCSGAGGLASGKERTGRRHWLRGQMGSELSGGKCQAAQDRRGSGLRGFLHL